MLKRILPFFILIAVIGAVAAGVYLIVTNGTAGLAQTPEGIFLGEGRGGAPEGQFEGRGNRLGARDGSGAGNHRGGGEESFSWAGFPGVGIQALKIAVITLLVVSVRAVVRFFQRRKRMRPAAGAAG